ncbi:MAG TPA: vitamin K epoxide reductase family protein, partial [Blastocatellia bacterium]|nr:vitamin K epoxide reductase family protein [Blastocatellia bacterium]
DICDAGSLLDCSAVLGSEYAKVGGIPLSFLGAVAYFLVFSLAVLATYNYKSAAKWLAVLVAVMFATSIYLFFVQAFALHHYCPYCLFSAAVTVTLTCLVWIPRFMRRTS